VGEEQAPGGRLHPDQEVAAHLLPAQVIPI
jgi:hypothetical protein